MADIKSQTLEFAGQTLKFETGELAPRADASVVVQYGETVVMAAVTVSTEDTDRDYFPLGIEYIEKYYAGGVISGSRFIKRERFPSERAVLVARQVDHSIRPLFPKGFKKEVSIVLTLLAYDGKNDPEMLTVAAASAALMISSVPFAGPAASVKIGLKEGSLIVNPGADEHEGMDLDMVVSCNENNILNLEGWAKEVSEDKMDEILDLALEQTHILNDFQKTFAEGLSKEKLKFEVAEISEDLKSLVADNYATQLEEALYNGKQREELMARVEKEIKEQHDDFSKSDIHTVVDTFVKKMMREGILREDKRASGRGLKEIREITIKPNYLPRVHGSALFQRGKTQVLSIVTLGSTRLEQQLESYLGEETKSFMHHYAGPPYSFGSAGRFSYYPGRREIGHGALGENALREMIPDTEDFPYTIRVASEVMSQNGSSSMASTCGATLALMQAGVPIKAPVAGVSVGLVTNDDVSEYKILTDIEGFEDFNGDMDFKLTGTEKGVTAVQLDSKLHGVPAEILKAAMRQSREGRLEILEKMHAALPQANERVSEYAPKVASTSIDPTKIGELIGPGGKIIKGITEETGIDIDIQDDGSVFLAGATQEGLDRALEIIASITMEPEIGKEYDGTVAKLMNFGAFVDISPSVTGLVHVSEIKDGFVKDINEELKEGQKVRIKIKGKDDQGKLSFTMKGVTQPE